MQEKIFPPDEKDWIELATLKEEKFISNFLFYRMRIYANKVGSSDALSTIEFLDCGVILKGHATGASGKVETYFYLLLSDGCWVKGLEGSSYDIGKPESEVRNGERFMRLTISVNTKDGVRRRIIRKKIPEKK